ncbi:hypothetical protein CSHISOI_03239 [Colletotrichum shisoi]|uniref:Uncharacterized protein n=1 Tax=Colletotrichum shisoi TaxID=2078593 RepID=A0A5Q4BZ19_9PEZI|nr:hypothetical protein CSHISOI_03239 [Colletotrichum shisoi]
MANLTKIITPKKRYLVNLDATPCSPAKMLAPADLASQTSSIATTSTRISTSRKSSPTKQLISLKLANNLLHFTLLNILEINLFTTPSLRDVYLNITTFVLGVNVILKDYYIT